MPDKAVVLIVDDVASNVQVLAECLKEDYHIKVATSGQRCLELMQEAALPDLVLLDVVMPEMDGYQVIKALKGDSKTADIPVIFVTGREQEEEEELGLNVGAVDYITKPIRPAIVQARVKTQIKIKQQRDQLLSMAMRDQLTGLYNRHYLVDAAQQKLSQARRHKNPLSVLLIDVDHFKSVNDNHGHATGDLILQEMAKALEKSCRKEDIVARFGGEEFVIILDQCSLAHCKSKAENVCQRIELLQPNQQRVTISIGCAALDIDSNIDEGIESLLSRADKALYEAKDQGRNCVMISES